jgi:Trypsin
VKMVRHLAWGLVLVPGSRVSIVIRHDVPDSRYRVSPDAFPALVELPEEGQGVLISRQWVVTAAHAVVGRPIREVTIHGTSRPVADVIVHAGYKAAPKELETGEAAPLMAFKAQTDDIALIKLAQPVSDVVPARLYMGAEEAGQVVEIFGRGSTGNGLVGQYPSSPHRGELRRAYTHVISADGQWLGMRFEAPPTALPLEGVPADGDSGGPVLMKTGDSWRLVGLVSRKFATGDLLTFRYCRYGQITYQVRISHYAGWIDGIIGRLAPKRA